LLAEELQAKREHQYANNDEIDRILGLLKRVFVLETSSCVVVVITSLYTLLQPNGFVMSEEIL
jgi:hypothetical protein